ncbi:glycoside hydrolase family 3 protein [Agromyces cerinus]|uniref:Beta-N-acetylhexosaminidase n=1 Tax=Agromyces cerinus subsp. cerinus TaxID=232089 RepID=A0A1N6FIA3_9MICO|nr:glycoside hydrolase family 3 N-terminal domain-containing protein [Agromyces cerinus]SIN95018.1 beta-N-acetylhexosaminidase [Agromyces cerinus subsp. cerinus]
MTGTDSTGAGTDLRRDILTTLLPGFDGLNAPEWVLGLLRDGLGGVCLFGQNIESPEQLRSLNATLRTANPLAVIAIDEEGGDVTRLFYDRGAPFPGNAVLGRIDDVELTARVAAAVGEALAATGCTVAFAPDVDVNANADNPVIGIRSFGADPELVARHSAAWTTALQQTGVAASAKHFPGHGDTATDSHLALPVVDVPLATLRERELVPFRAAIAAGSRTIMTSHILMPELDPENPATLSPQILNGLLRGELGFEGVIVTDALDMKGASGVHGIPEAAVRALAAGCDLLCIGSDNSAEEMAEIVGAVEVAIATGRLPEARVRESAARVRALAAESVPVPAGPALPASIEPRHDAEEIGRVIGAFEVTDAARQRLARSTRVGTVVRVDAVANIAVGVAPWGPFAAEDVSENPSWLGGAETVAVSAQQGLVDPAGLDGVVLVVGKDLHRHEFARAAIDALRAVRDDVVTIDMGWPSNDRAYADVSTFGASRLLGEAVIEFVDDALRAAVATS